LGASNPLRSHFWPKPTPLVSVSWGAPAGRSAFSGDHEDLAADWSFMGISECAGGNDIFNKSQTLTDWNGNTPEVRLHQFGKNSEHLSGGNFVGILKSSN
jgi:hypothetical protein